MLELEAAYGRVLDEVRDKVRDEGKLQSGIREKITRPSLEAGSALKKKC